MRSFVVLGIGRFGESVAKALYESGYEVLAIDKNEEVIQDISEHVTHAIVGDITDESVLKSIGVRNFDVAVVAVGNNMESSILVTVILKEMGIKYILAKAQNDLHAKVLNRVGADRVVFPERDMGIRVAHNLVSANILDYIELSPDYSIIEVKAPESWNYKTLKQLDVRAKYGLNIMAIRTSKDVNISPHAEDIIRKDDILVVIGSNSDINRLEKSWKED